MIFRTDELRFTLPYRIIASDMFHRLLGGLLIGFVLYGQNGATYKDPNAPLDRRVDDLLSRMTLDEKASQMLSDSPAIERLGVPEYDYWSEGGGHLGSGPHIPGRHSHLGRGARETPRICKER